MSLMASTGVLWLLGSAIRDLRFKPPWLIKFSVFLEGVGTGAEIGEGQYLDATNSLMRSAMANQSGPTPGWNTWGGGGLWSGLHAARARRGVLGLATAVPATKVPDKKGGTRCSGWYWVAPDCVSVANMARNAV